MCSQYTWFVLSREAIELLHGKTLSAHSYQNLELIFVFAHNNKQVALIAIFAHKGQIGDRGVNSKCQY